MRSTNRVAALVAVSGLLLSACGGGGGGGGASGSSSGGTTTPPPQGSPVVSLVAPKAVASYATVTIDASASSDAKSSIATFKWTQTSGPAVTLSNANSAAVTFLAPNVSSAASIGLNLTITDALGTTASKAISIPVNPAKSGTVVASLIGFEFQRAITGNPHNDSVPTDNAPQAGAASILHVILSGAIATANFSFIDTSGNSLSTLSLVQTSTGATQPTDFYGGITVPTVPFQLRVTGTTGDGATFSLTSQTTVTPIAIALHFVPTIMRIKPGATATVNLQIANGGPDITINLIVLGDSVMTVQPLIANVTIPQGQTVSTPFTVTFPATGRVQRGYAIASAAGAQIGVTGFTAIRDGAP